MDLEREASSSSSASALFMEEEGEEGLPTVMLKAMLSSAMMSRQEEEVEKEEEGEEQQGGKQKRRHSLMARPTASTSLLSQTLEHCLRAMFKGNPPQQKQSSVCGKIWGSGHMAYRCKNCQVTPNSCICVDCFQKGNHEGHDYRLYSSGYGGCCDCGDPEAWNPKGFCSDHGAQAQEQLQNFSQDVARELILTALRLLQRYLKQYLSFSRTKQNRRDSRKLITLLLWLHKVCSYGDIPRRIVAEVVVNLTQEQDVSKKQLDEEAESKQKTPAEISLTKKITIPQATIIDLLLRACCHMERDEKKEDSDEEPKDTLSNSCMMLCMDCLYEPSFKATFAHRYVQNYGMLFLSSLHPGKTRQMDRILTTLGAQLFNIESLVVSITKQDKLLNTLLNLIILLVEEYSVLKKPQKRELTASSTAAVSAEVEGGEEEEEAEVEVEEDGPETRRERELERQRRVEEMTEQVEAVPEEAELLEQMVEARQHSSQHPTDFSPRLKKEEEEEEEEVENESTRATSTTESKKEKGRLVVECRSNLLSRDESPFTRICSDFEQALKYSKVARFLLFKGNNLYDKWLSLLSYFQDMGELRHQKHEHVAYETEEWRNAYFIELQLLNCIPFVSSSLRKHLITYDGKSHFFKHSQPFLRTKHVIRQCLAAIERCYDSDDVEWKRLPVPQVVIEDERNDQEGMMELEHQHPQKTIPALSYSLLQNPVSVHISLHRMLSAFLFEIGCRERLKPHHLRSNYHSANQQSDEDQLKSLKRSLARFGTEVESESHLHISLEELFFGGEKQKQEPNRTEEEATEEKGKEKDQATTGTSKELTTTSAGATIEDVIRFLEQPLRCHALFAQIQAGLWNKNGAQTIWGTYSLYKSSFMFGDALDLDILAIQCAAILLGSNNFLALALDRFELSDWFVIGGASVLSQDDTDATLIVAEEFLRFILSIATNRTSISAENNLRRQLIHWLAVKDLPHSQLVDKLKYRSEFDEVFSSERIEATLGEIADYIPPRVGKQGCYSLKPECWAEFDPCFPHFSRQHLSSAAENFQKAAANFSAALEDATAAKKGSILPIRAPARPYLMFERIHDDLLLNSNAVFSILFTVLYNASLVYLSPSKDRSEESSNNKRLISDYLLDYSLRYLYLMVKCKGSAGPSPPPTTKAENSSSSFSSPPSGIPEGTSWRELRFPKEDVIAKLKHEIRFSTVNEKQAATSMLDILLKLSQVAELKDKHELIKKTLEMIGECDVSAQNYIQRVLQPAEEDAESAKKAARERARARILAQMEKSRQAFKQSMGGIEDVGEEVQEGDAMAVARPALASHHNKVECCLCREVKLPYEDNPLGLIGVCKRSRLLNLANRLTAKAITVKGTKEEEKELKGKEKTETPASQNEAKRAKKTKTRSEEEEKEETEESTRDYLEDEMVDADEFVEMEELEDNFRSEVQEGLDIARELEAGLEGLAQPQLLQSFWSFLDRVRGRREEEDEEDEQENEENEELVDDEEQHLEDEIYQQEWEQQMEDLFTRAEEETSSDKQQPQERKHESNARKSDEKNLRDAAKNLWRSHVRIGSQIYSCGHVIHVRCFENYLQTRRQATDLFSALEMSLNRNLKEYWCPQCRQFSNVLIPLSPSRYFKRHQAKKEKEKEKEDTRWSSEFAAKWLDNTLERGLLSGLREREHTEEESSSASSTSTHEEEQWMKQHLYVFGRQIESICKYRKLAIPSFMRLSSSLPSSSAPSSSADQERGQEDETASSPFSSVTSLFGSAFGGNSSEGDAKREERTVERRRKEELRMALYLCHLFSYDVAALDLALASMLPDGAQVHQSSTMIPQLKPIQLNTLKDFCNVVASFTSSIDESNMLRCLALLSYSMGLRAPEPFSSCSHSVLQRMSLPVLCTNIFDTMVLCFVLRNALQAKDEEDELEEPLSAFSPILCLFYSCYVVQCLLCVYLQQASLGAVSPPPTSHRPTVAPLESLLSCYQHIALCFGDQNRTSSINAEELRQTVKRQCVPFLRQVFFFFQAWNDHPPVFLAHDSKLTASPSGEEEEEGNQEQEENRVEETFERLCEVLHLPSDLDDLFKTSPVAFHSIADDWIHRFLKEMLLERKAVVQDRLEDEKLHQHEMDIVLEEARIATEEVQEEKEEEEEEQEEEDLKEQTQKKKEEKTKGRTEVAEEEEEDFITFIQRYVNARKIFATQELALRPPIGLVKPPKLFQDLFHAYLHETCPRCGTVPKKAAVCLICADYLCAHSPCCTFDVGECFEHAVSCGGGTGMFLLVRTSGVLLISDEKACIWGSPYLDQFGEEDVSFRRGKPLRLEERVYNHLNNVFLNQRLDGEILRSDVSSLKQVQSARLW